MPYRSWRDLLKWSLSILINFLLWRLFLICFFIFHTKSSEGGNGSRNNKNNIPPKKSIYTGDVNFCTILFVYLCQRINLETQTITNETKRGREKNIWRNKKRKDPESRIFKSRIFFYSSSPFSSVFCFVVFYFFCYCWPIFER